MDVVGGSMIIFPSLAGATAVQGRGNHSFMDRLFESEGKDWTALDGGHHMDRHAQPALALFTRVWQKNRIQWV